MNSGATEIFVVVGGVLAIAFIVWIVFKFVRMSDDIHQIRKDKENK